jgi:uncharacterized cofD-like protein
MFQNKINITTIGGWTGTYNVLSGLKQNENYNLAAIVTMSDSGGSTGLLRDEFWVLPPWDIRRAILALSNESEILRKLFEYRFEKESSVSGHTVGNLLLTALADITGDFGDGIKEINKMFKVKGKVIPVTMEQSNLCVELENGLKVCGESNIDVPAHDANLRIVDAYLEPEVKVNSVATGVLENSDIIVIWPGDLYTSIVPNLLVKWVKKAIKNSNAKVIYFCNIMTKHWETSGFEVQDFIDVIETYLWKWIVDYIVVNNGNISETMVQKYKEIEGKKPVKIKDKDRKELKHKDYKIIERDMLNEQDFVRHSSKKIASIIDDLVEGWIK